MLLTCEKDFGYFGKWRLFMVCAMALLMFGCREYYMYAYKPVSEPLFEGELTVLLEGSYGKGYVVEGKKKADFSFPYTLTFELQLPSEVGLSRMVVKDIVLLGESSQLESKLPDVESKIVYGPSVQDPNRTFKNTRAVIKALEAGKNEYENYLLSATIIVFSTSDEFRETDVSVELITNFRTEKRSDKYDEEMGI
jgi:hypothetical protein